MALSNYLDLHTLNLEGELIFLRLDLNVPMQDGKIVDRTRIDAALPTLRFLLEKGCRIVAASHLGRPTGDAEALKKFSLEPVAEALNESGIEVLLMDRPDSDAPLELIKKLKGSQIILLENLRFADGETKNSQDLAQKWSRYCDVYINDAFGACHRAHASIDALPRLKASRCYGLLIEKELQALDTIAKDPAQPFVFVTGGSKVSDKLPLLESFSTRAQTVLIGGAMAYTFLVAQGVPVGDSLVEKDKVGAARQFLKRMENLGKKVLLPVDHILVEKIGDSESRTSSGSGIEKGWCAVDIGPKTQALYAQALQSAGSVFWNGPMGMYETPAFAKGSVAVAQAMATCSGFTVVGGGDSAAVVAQAGLSGDMSHISTGGGASMQYLQGEALPGLEILKVRTVV